jgi:hypothetical protein
MPRLPQPGTDDGIWGDLLNEFLLVEHTDDGSLRLDKTLAVKYTKPTAGIPEDDLTDGVRAKLNQSTVDTSKLFNKESDTTDAIVESDTKKFLSSTDKTKLESISSNAEVNVKADWNATEGDAEILNKPAIPTVLVQSVNTKTGAVVLTTDDISDSTTTNKYVTEAEKSKLAAITGDNTGDQDLSTLVLKTTTVNGHALSENISITKGDVGLADADNTSDANKPISIATQTALNSKVNSSSLAPVATSGSYNSLTDKPVIRSGLTPTATITTAYTAAANEIVLVDATAGNVTVSLPTAADGLQIAVKKVDTTANTVFIQRAGTDTIGAASSATITLRVQDETRTFIGRTGSWIIASSSYSLASLDARFGVLSSTHVLSWTYSEAYTMLSITRDGNDAISSATVQWPDGSTGTFNTDIKNSSFPGAIDAFRVTYVPAIGATRTITQSAVTRNANGAVIARPALVIT